MRQQKVHKKELKPKLKDQIGDTIYHGKILQEKVKYNYKNHWLEEELDVAPNKIKKKRKS